jgi:putative phage-type endonuclease
VDYVQGTPEWLDYRKQCYNASDAPAMLGVSKYKSRAKLIKEMLGEEKQESSTTKALFQRGHEAEDLARGLAELILGGQLAPLVGRDERMHSASFDGITEDHKTIWEHKMLNDLIRKEGLHKMYRVQMEQQLYISGAEVCLFTATKWHKNILLESREFIYYPDIKLRREILQGWEQFRTDLADAIF